ncbi:SDR family NAD(P)-dependent oxidoreductase [Egicoccus halophilus]|uniref:NAD-dependent epimerase n=1 Tax=Egicoccus halophilus TaxID=1670830 RepID=A0A8J3ESA7_9ACTN|nr:SDR family NAD(P)-dependent oxidoreductase [Egicoccus halophilus]GGI06941.1 NAD-dependent epimerase [Egicoccus halophilus]
MDVAFEGRVALVTGGSRGIGRATCRRFAEAGARVVVHFRADRTAAEATLAELPGDGHLALAADLADPVAVDDLVSDVVAACGRLDVVVNNAGIYEDHPVTGTDYAAWQAAWQRTLGTNLIGPANLIHRAVPHLIAAGGGRIVNVSSRGAFRGEPGHTAYGAAKAGLNSLGQSLAQELAPHGIFVTTVAPGFVETDMTEDHLAGARGAAIRAQSPLGRAADPDEIARTIVFLATPGTEYATGAIVDVNGASYLRN